MATITTHLKELRFWIPSSTPSCGHFVCDVRSAELLTMFGMQGGSGPAWVLSIVGLTIFIRILIIPLFQTDARISRRSGTSARNQEDPEEVQGPHRSGSRSSASRELQALYRDHGTSPFAACMPMLIQMPIFFALFRLLYAVLPLSNGT